MHFDDRLATVLRLPASGDALARIQFRQLVDILGRPRREADFGPLHEAGLHQLEQLARHIPADERARLVGCADRPIANPRLLALFAQEEPQVATAAVKATELDENAWIALIPKLPVRARGILRHRRDLGPRIEALLETLGIGDRGLPPVTDHDDDILDTTSAMAIPDTPVHPDGDTQAVEASPAEEEAGPTGNASLVDHPAAADEPSATDFEPFAEIAELAIFPSAEAPDRAPGNDNPGRARQADAGIGAIVRRIEEFRKARESIVPSDGEGDAPRLPLGDFALAGGAEPLAIDFATNQAGRITWVDGALAPSLVGFNLFAAPGYPDRPERQGADPAATLRARLPLRGCQVQITGALLVSGPWQADAVPQFDALSGRFIGYRGRLRRPLPAPLAEPALTAAEAESDQIRQILHELRNPANAIQVAAEIIQQQLYGPAPHEYRALAAAIAGDVAQILAGFEELERLVKFETGTQALSGGECDLAEIVEQTIVRLQAWTAPRRSGFVRGDDVRSLRIGIDQQEAERMIWRILAALAGATAPDEQLTLELASTGGRAGIAVALPAALLADGRNGPFDMTPLAAGQSLSAGMFGAGFSLRLGAAEAASVGGSLLQDDDRLVLNLPGLTRREPGHSTVASRTG